MPFNLARSREGHVIGLTSEWTGAARQLNLPLLPRQLL